MRINRRKNIGALGERHARKLLESQGCRLLAANWRCRVGEVDLVMLDRDELVVVEVKTRLRSPWAQRLIFETITPRKTRKLRVLAEICAASFSRRNGLLTVRIDLVGVVLHEQSLQIVSIDHLKYAL